MNAIKAIRATIKLGDIKLDVFQLPDGSYRYSKTGIEASLGFEPTRRAYRNFLTSKDAKALRAKELTGGDIKFKDITHTYTLVSQEQVTLFWGFQAQNGNSDALALLMAVAQEALERRADSAFGVKRTEEQRNQFLKARMEGKCVRRTLTDSIKEYIDRHPELSENYSRFVYSNCTDCVNLVVLGAKSKQVKVELDLKPTGLLRDVIPYATLREIEAVEVLAGRLIDAEDQEPLEACKKALQLIHARTLGYGQ
jgi:hypothetical protein